MNKNTKKNIELREKTDMIGRETVNSEYNENIDVGGGYIIDKNRSESKYDIEMKDLIEIEIDFEEVNDNINK